MSPESLGSGLIVKKNETKFQRKTGLFRKASLYNLSMQTTTQAPILSEIYEEFYAFLPKKFRHKKQDVKKHSHSNIFCSHDTVYVESELTNGAKGHVVTAKWYVVDADDQEPGYLIGASNFVIEENGSYCIKFYFDPPIGGWPRGEYKTEMYLNSKLRKTHRFSIE